MMRMIPTKSLVAAIEDLLDRGTKVCFWDSAVLIQNEFEIKIELLLYHPIILVLNSSQFLSS